MYITDCFFTQGTRHVVCEDYTTHNDDTIIVCDGCSSSPDTDFGARILARLSLSQISTFGSLDPELMSKTVEKAILSIPTLSTKAADATLLSAKVSRDDTVSVKVFGDGVVVKIDKDDVSVYVFDHETGAPGYISYFASETRKNGYIKSSEGKKRILKRYEYTKESLQKLVEEYLAYIEQISAKEAVSGDFEVPEPAQESSHENLGALNLEFNKPEAILLFSDGLETFNATVDLGGGQVQKLRVPIPVVLGYLLNIKKVKNQNYMTRRARKFLTRDVTWKPYDDFSVASIWRKG